MKAIIIQDHDARALVDQLELHAFRQRTGASFDGKTPAEIVEALHRGFHFVVVRWLQEQGASVLR